MYRHSLSQMIEGALIIALSFILSLIKIQITPYFGISLGSIPVILYALRHGWKAGLGVGLLSGIFRIIMGQAIWLSFSQGMIEYTLPYASLGLAGLLAPHFQAKLGKDRKAASWILVLAASLGIISRYFWHFLAGVIYWSAYAPEGMSPYLYSFLVNGGSALGTLIGTLSCLLLLVHQSRQIFIPKG